MQKLFRHQIADKCATQKKLSFELGKNREQPTKMQMETAKILTGTAFIHRRIWHGSSKSSKRESGGGRNITCETQGKKAQRQGSEMVISVCKQFKPWAEGYDSVTRRRK